MRRPDQDGGAWLRSANTAGIKGALGVDVVGAVLFSGPVAGGHHDAALAAR
jgi:hypothetical protein